jgi:adenylate cyclase
LTSIRLPALVFGLVCALGLLLIRIGDPYLVRALRELAFDQLQVLSPRPFTDQPVRIVDIDEASLSALGQWPWPRDRLAKLVDRLRTLGAAAIAFDIVFIEPDRLSPSHLIENADISRALHGLVEEGLDDLPDNDALFAQAMQRAPVVLGFGVLSREEGSLPDVKATFAFTGESVADAPPFVTSATRNLPELEAASAGIGSISLSPQAAADVLRRIPMVWSDGEQFYPSLALEALRVAQGERTYVVFGAHNVPATITAIRVGQFEVPTAPDGEMWIHYTKEDPRRYVSASRLLGDVVADDLRPLIEGHIMLIGTSAVGLLDIRTVATGERIPGVSVHAQALEQIISGAFLTRPDWLEMSELTFFVVVSMILVVVTVFFGPTASLLIGGSAAVVIVLAAWQAFARYGLLLDGTFLLAGGVILHFSLTSYRYLTTDRERRAMRAAFAHYVAPSILAEIEKDPRQVRLGGEVREVTIMFMDIRGFTALSERLAPTEVVAFLNRLLGEMSKHIVEQSGTLDKFIGDSIMAFWNAPLEVAGHQRLACLAALAMRAELERLNSEDAFRFQERHTHSAPIQIAVGIGAGPACVGNIGSEKMFNYSAIGDTVNVSSRVQDHCRAVDFDIVVSQAVAAAASDLALLDAGAVSLKGRGERLRIFVLVGDAQTAADSSFQELRERHEKLLAALQRGDCDLEALITDCRHRSAEISSVLPGFYARMADRPNDFR